MRSISSRFLCPLLLCLALLPGVFAGPRLSAQGVPALPQDGLSLWLQSGAQTTLDESGRVASWGDSSGRATVAAQADEDQRPALVDDLTSGRQVVHFDGVNDRLVLPDILNAAEAGEIFIVARLQDFDIPVIGLCHFGTSGGTAYSDGGVWDDFGAADVTGYGGAAAGTLTRWHIFNSSVGTDGVSVVRFNGIERVRRTAQAVSFRADPEIGGNYSGESFKGDIGEVVVFDRALSAVERAQVVSLLQQRYLIEEPPAVPENLVPITDPRLSGLISLHWTQGSSSLVAYEVQRKGPADADYLTVASGLTKLVYEDTAVIAGSPYSYRVRALNGFGQVSAYAEPVSATYDPLLGEAVPGLGIKLWLRADAGLSINDNGVVTGWQDQSGASNHAVANSSATGVTVVPAAANGRPAIGFGNGYYDELVLPGLLMGEGAAEMFIVVNAGPLEGDWKSFGSVLGTCYYPNSDGFIHDYSGGFESNLGATPQALNTYVIYNVAVSPAGKIVRINELIQYDSGPILPHSIEFPDSGELGYSNIFAGGRIAEVLVYNRVIEPLERTQTIEYLQQKYALIAPPAEPAGIAVVDGLSEVVAVHWEAGAAQQSSYEVQRKGPGDTDYVTVAQSLAATRFEDTAVSAGETYVYRVRTVNGLGQTSGYTQPVAATYDPDLVTSLPGHGLRLWLRADVGITLDTNGLVERWKDQSGNGVDGTGLNLDYWSIYAPVVEQGIFGGQPAVRFGTDNGISLKSVLPESEEAELFIVIRKDPVDADQQGCDPMGSLLGELRFDSIGGRISDGAGDRLDVLGRVAPFEQPFVYAVAVGAEEKVVRVDGVPRFHGVRSGTVAIGDCEIGFGPDNYEWRWGFRGYVAEILLYRRGLSASERAQVIGYLQAKYNLLPSPIVPTAVEVTPILTGGLELSWQTGDGTRSFFYEVQRLAPGESVYSTVATDLSSPFWTDRLPVGGSYSYRVCSLDASGRRSEYSAPTSVSYSPVVAPIPVTGIRYWLRSDAGLTADEANNVVAWRDQSGEGNVAVPPLPTMAPALAPGDINGKPSVRFLARPEGTPSGLMLGRIQDSATAGEYFVVLRNSSDGSYRQQLASFYPGHKVYYSPSEKTLGENFLRGGDRDSVTIPYPIDVEKTHVLNVAASPENWVLRLNGAYSFAFAPITALIQSDMSARLGAQSEDAYDGYSGSIAEIVVYDRVLTEEERSVVMSYFQDRYRYAPPPPVPSVLTNVSLSGTEVRVGWVADGVVSFDLEREVDGSGVFESMSEALMTSEWRDRLVSAGHSYVYRVRSRNAVGEVSDWRVTTSVTGVGTAPPVPLSGLRLWLNAGAGVRTKNVSGSDYVMAWQDQSGSGNDAVSQSISSTTVAPTLVVNDMNGNPAVSFSGSYYYLRLPGVMGGATEGEYFVVARQATANSDGSLCQLYPEHSSRYFSTSYSPGLPTISDNFLSSEPFSFVPGIDSTVCHLYNVAAKPGEWSARINGLLAFSQTEFSVASPAVSTVAGSLGVLSGAIAEVLCYDRALTGTERDQVHQYLQFRYGLFTVPAVPVSLTSHQTLANSEVVIDWQGGANSNCVFEVERMADDETEFSVVATGLTRAGFRDAAALVGHTYTYRVRARNALGAASAPSGTISVSPVAVIAPIATNGMLMWLRADTGVKTSAIGSSSVADFWRDQSGHGNDAVASMPRVGTNRPSVVANAVNGTLPALAFDYSDDTLRLPDLYRGAQSGEFIVVFKRNGYGYSSSYASRLGVFHSGNAGVYGYSRYSGGSFSDNFLSTQSHSFNPACDVSSWHVVGISSRTGEWTVRTNGLVRLTAADNVVPVIDAASKGSICLGSTLNGSVAEVIFYDHVLSEVERSALLQYLNGRYNLIPAPTAPAVPKVEQALVSGEVALSWDVGTTIGGTFEVERQADGESGFALIASGIRGTTFSDVTAVVGRTYTYRVIARNALGVASAPSGETVFTVAVPAPAIPVTGLRLWLRADKGLSTTVSGTTTSVTAWRDQSGLRNDAVASGGATSPTLAATGFNGQPALVFSSTSMSLGLPAFLANVEQGEALLVLRMQSSSSYQGSVARFYGYQNLSYSTSGTIQDSFLQSSYRSIFATVDVTIPHVYDVSARDGEWLARLNGVVASSALGQNVSSPGSSPGAGSLGGGFYGSLAEVLVFDRVLTEAERTQVLGYLNARYSIIPAPSAPEGLTIHRALANGEVSVDWIMPAQLNGMFELERRGDGETEFSVIASGLTTNNYRDLTIQNGRTYEYRVCFRNALGSVSSPSAIAVLSEIASPAPIATTGLRLWLRSDRGLVLSPQSGTDYVTAWRDQSGRRSDATAPGYGVNSVRPKRVAAGLGEFPVVEFDNYDDHLSLPDILESGRPAEVFYVLKKASASAQRMLGHLYSSSNAYYPYNSTDIRDNFLSNTDHQFPSLTSITDYHLYNVAAGAGEWTARMNGLVAFTSTQNTVPLFTSDGYNRIGTGSSNYYSSSYSFDGDLAELIVFDRVLSSGERDEVYAYLQDRYNLIPEPAVPTALAASTLLTKPEVTLVWRPGMAGQATKYELQRRREDEPSFLTVATDLRENTYSDAGVGVGQVYRYRVCAVDGLGRKSAFSEEATVTVEAPVSAIPASGIALWLRADCGVLTDANGYVTIWRDQSGLNRHAKESFAAYVNAFNHSVVIADAIHGRPTINMEGRSAFDFGDGLTRMSHGEAFVFLRKNSASGDAALWSDNSSAYPAADGTVREPFGWKLNYGHGTFSPSVLLTDYHLYEVSAGASWVARFNGAECYRVDGCAQNYFSEIEGIASSNSGYLFDGEVAEVLIYNRVLTDAERQSVEIYFANRYQATAVAPTLAPAPGLYSSPVAVTITAVAGAEIYSTTDGSEPTALPELRYTGPITIDRSTRIKAIAVIGGKASTPTAGLYSIGVPPATETPNSGFLGTYYNNPDFSGTSRLQRDTSLAFTRYNPQLLAGSASVRWTGTLLSRFSETHTFSVECTGRAQLWIGDTLVLETVNGTGSGTILLSAGQGYAVRLEYVAASAQNVTNEAVALRWSGLSFAAEIIPSRQVRSGLPYATIAGTPVATPAGCLFTESLAVALSASTPANARINYTVDGSEPTPASPLYTGPLTFSRTTTLKAKAFVSGYSESGVRVETYTLDNQPPVLSGLTFNAAAVPAQIGASGSFAVNATDSSGIARVEFHLGARVLGIDRFAADGFSALFSIDDTADGPQTLTVQAWDNLGLASDALTVPIEILQPPPPAPVITSPANASKQSRPEVLIRGRAQPRSLVRLQRSGQVLASGNADATGAFAFNVTLVPGVNPLTATAQNRNPAPSAPSDTVAITFDNTIPAPPVALAARSRKAGAIELSWQAPAGGVYTGFYVFRSAEPITADATLAPTSALGGGLIRTFSFSDMPPADGKYYYRVITAYQVGQDTTLSIASNQADALSDRTPPAASIRLEPLGTGFDPVGRRFGRGMVNVVLTTTEQLASPPFLNLAISGGAPIFVDLNAAGIDTYTGVFSVGTQTASGAITPVFSGLDRAGNRGTEIALTAPAAIDVQGPIVTGVMPVRVIESGALEELPLYTAIKNEPQPLTVYWRFTLDEVPRSGTTPGVTATLSSQPGATLAATVTDAGDTDAHTWLVTLLLPATAGSVTESLTLAVSSEDDLGNTGTKIVPPHQFQVYQGNLPPLAIPSGLQGEPHPAGEIVLTWQSVSGAAGYVLQVKAPAAIDFVDLILPAGPQVSYTYTPTTDGVYAYRIASMRYENGADATSGWSTPVPARSDRVAPPAPTALTFAVMAEGLAASWISPAAGLGDVEGYALYRNGSAITADAIDGLDPVVVSIPKASVLALDPRPAPTLPYYALVAFDDAGNRSAPALGFANVSLLPVRTIAVSVRDSQAPVLEWQPAPGSEIDGFRLSIDGAPGEIEGAMIEVKGARLISPTTHTYTDSAYAGGLRRYSVSCVSGSDSKDRPLTLPVLDLTLAEGSRIAKGLPGTLQFLVHNKSAEAYVRAQLQVRLGDKDHVSTRSGLAAGEEKVMAVVVGGYDDLPAERTTLQAKVFCEPQVGASVSVIRTLSVPVVSGSITAELVPGGFTRGGNGKVRFRITNPSDLPIDIKVARHNGDQASDEVHLILSDLDGTILSRTDVRIPLGDDIVNLPGGDTILRIPAGQTVTSPELTVPVPLSSPPNASIGLVIDSLYYSYGYGPEQVTLKGPTAHAQVSTRETAYTAQIDTITPSVAYSRQPIAIRGRAFWRPAAEGLPLAVAPDVKVTVSVEIEGFVRTETVTTDGLGLFEYQFVPGRDESGGVYHVWASHPDIVFPPDAPASFSIGNVIVSPRVFSVRVPRNYRYEVPIKATTGAGAAVQNLRVVQVGTLPAGVTVTTGVIAAVTPNQTVTLPLSILGVAGASGAVDTGSVYFEVLSDGPGGEALHWADLEVPYVFSDPKPILQGTPNPLWIGVEEGKIAAETLTLKNQGFAALENATVSILPQSGVLKSWIRLQTSLALGPIDVGASVPVTITAAPPESGDLLDNQLCLLRVQGTNTATVFEYPFTVTVMPKGAAKGSIDLQVIDPYFGFTLADGAVNSAFDGLSGAHVSLEKETVLHESAFSVGGITDASGGYSTADLPVGYYKLRITADKHEPYIQRIAIRPGIVYQDQVFLSYAPVTFSWEVVPITFQDRYDIVLHATYETNVPVPVVVVEPGFIPVQKMCAGQVQNGEVLLTNHGLIRADNVKFNLPADTEYYAYEALATIGDSLAAGESVKIPYRIRCLKAWPEDCPDAPAVASESAPQAALSASVTTAGEPPLATAVAPAPRAAAAGGSGCAGWSSCAAIPYTYPCANGESRPGSARYCTGRAGSGNCPGGGGANWWIGGGGWDGWGGWGGWGGGGGTSSGTGYSDDCAPAPGPQPSCPPAPPPDEGDKKCPPKDDSPGGGSCSGRSAGVGSWVDLPSRQYLDSVIDLTVPVRDGTVTSTRVFNHRRWNVYVADSIFAACTSTSLLTEQWMLLINGRPYDSVARIPVTGDAPTKLGTYDASLAPVGLYRFGTTGTDTVEKRADGTLVWSNGSVARRTYDSSGRLLQRFYQDRLVATYHYDSGTGLLATVADFSGRTVLTCGYTDGHLTSVVDVAGRSVGYAYDSLGRLQKITGVNGLETSYTYDDWWHLTGKQVHRPGTAAEADTIETISYRILPTVDPVAAPAERVVSGYPYLGDVRRGFVTRVAYSTGKTHDFFYRYDSGTDQFYTKQVDAGGREEENIYSRSGVLLQKLVNGVAVEQIEQDERTRVTTHGNQRTVEEYDELGNLTRRTEADGAITQYVYDPATRKLLRITDPLGMVTAYTYDDLGNRLSVTEAVGTTLERASITTYVTGTNMPLLRTRPDDAHTAYEYFPDGTLQREYDPVHPEDQTGYTYDSLRRMLTSTDALGRTTSYEYDAADHQTKVTNPLGEQTVLTYDGDLLAQVETGRTATLPGRIARFSYDADGHRTEERRVLDDGSERVVTTLTYDAEGRLVASTNALGQTESYVYDAAGNRTAVQQPNSTGGLAESISKYDAFKRVVETVSPSGTRTAIDYDLRNRPVLVTEGIDTLAERYTQQRYDLLGRVIETSQWDLQHPVQRYSTTATYDLLGRRTVEGGSRVYPSSITYDAANRPLTVTDALGQVQSSEYEQGRLVRQKLNGVLMASSTYDRLGNRRSTTDAVGNHRHYRYDALDRVTHESIPLAAAAPLPATWWEQPAYLFRVTTYTRFGEVDSSTAYTVVDGEIHTATTSSLYDALGQKVSETQSSAIDGVVVTALTRTSEYDLAGNPTRTNYPPVTSSGATTGTSETLVRSPYNAALVESVIDRTGAITRYTYDAASRPVDETNAFGGITRRRYDALGRVVETRQYLDAATAASDSDYSLPAIHPSLLSTRTAYNLFDQPVEVIHPDHVAGTHERKETFAYDSHGKLVTKGGAGGYPIAYGYDDVGRLHTLTDGNSHTTTWTYSPLAQGTPAQLTKTYADGKSFRYTFDVAGRPVTRLDARGRTTVYAYNAYGLPTGIDYPNDVDVAFTYDQQGRRLSMTDGSGTTDWTYTALGLTASETQSRAHRQLAFGYDGFGQRNSLAVSPLDASGAAVGSPWITTYGYDNAGRLQTVLDDRLPSGQPYRYSYAASSPWLAQIAMPGGHTTIRTPDSLGRLLSTTTKRSDATVIDSFAYTYDRAGQRSLETTPETTRTFGYDQYRQLTSAITGPESSLALALSYDFDSIGNRLTTRSIGPETQNPKPETTTTYTTNAVNQYTGIDTASSTSGTSTSTPAYDDNGNTTATSGSALTWDDENRLSTSTDGIITTMYVYDGLGRRVEKSEYEGAVLKRTSRYVYDCWRVVEELSSTSTSSFNLVRSYTRGLDLSGSFEGAGGIGSMLALTAPVTADGQPTTELQSASYVYDGNGNVTALVADDGTARAVYRYDPFGQRLVATGPWADLNPYQFSSKERDASTGFYYYGFRYYNPSTGRWPSRDPIGEQESPNLYGFVSNRPTSSFDVNGLYAVDGHFYTTYMLAVAAGYSRESALELAFYSQVPDAVKAYSAYNTWQDSLWKVLAQDDFYRDVQEQLHALHGGLAQPRRDCLRKLLQSSGLQTWEKGVLLHAFADAYGHSYIDTTRVMLTEYESIESDTYGKEFGYSYPMGHGSRGTAPDEIGPRQKVYNRYLTDAYQVLGGDPARSNEVLAPVRYAARFMYSGLERSARSMRALSQEQYGYYSNFAPEDEERFAPGGLALREKFRVPTEDEMKKLIEKIKCACK